MGILQILWMEFWKFRILEILNFHPCKCISELAEREPLAELCDRCMDMLEGMDEEVRHDLSIYLLVTICRLPMTFANSLDPDQAQHFLVWIQTVFHCNGRFLEIFFWKSEFWKKTTADNKKNMHNYPACRVEFDIGLICQIWKTGS